MTVNEAISLLQIKDVSFALLAFVIFLLSLIQITPLKLNPWDSILRWVGRRINGELEDKVGSLEGKVEDVRRDCEERAISDMRWHILNFAYTCRNSEDHTKEQWHHVLDQAKKYELYIEEHELDNGVIEEDTKYIRELYNRLSKEGRIK